MAHGSGGNLRNHVPDIKMLAAVELKLYLILHSIFHKGRTNVKYRMFVNPAPLNNLSTHLQNYLED